MPSESQVLEAVLAGLERDGLRGPGDDGCVLPPGPGELLATTDALEENEHFRPGWQSLEDLAWKALAVNLSDLAALGAKPVGYLLALAWPKTLPLAEARRLGAGLREAERGLDCPLLGGDTDVTDGPLRLGVTAFGRAASPVGRAGARVGDHLYVSGQLGGAACACARLLGGGRLDVTDPGEADALACFHRPRPRIDLGVRLAGHARAMMDLSDGLVMDLPRLARSSGVAVHVELERVPVHPAARAAAEPTRLALTGGEDYELLVAGDRGELDDFEELTNVGRVVEGEPGRVTWIGADAELATALAESGA